MITPQSDIQAEIDAETSGLVVFAPGHYYLDQPITLKPHTTYTGSRVKVKHKKVRWLPKLWFNVIEREEFGTFIHAYAPAFKLTHDTTVANFCFHERG